LNALAQTEEDDEESSSVDMHNDLHDDSAYFRDAEKNKMNKASFGSCHCSCHLKNKSCSNHSINTNIALPIKPEREQISVSDESFKTLVPSNSSSENIEASLLPEESSHFVVKKESIAESIKKSLGSIKVPIQTLAIYDLMKAEEPIEEKVEENEKQEETLEQKLSTIVAHPGHHFVVCTLCGNYRETPIENESVKKKLHDSQIERLVDTFIREHEQQRMKAEEEEMNNHVVVPRHSVQNKTIKIQASSSKDDDCEAGGTSRDAHKRESKGQNRVSFHIKEEPRKENRESLLKRFSHSISNTIHK
jgi:hypothetical protein